MTLTYNDILKLDIKKLRVELKSRKLLVGGNKGVLVNRLLQYTFEHLEDENKKVSANADRRDDRIKRMKMSVESMLEEYMCPISMELPVDPVTAMDGKIYERAFIATWIEKSHSAHGIVKSPATGASMDTKLIPAPHVFNSIQKLIEDNELESSHAKSWLERKKQRDVERKVDQCRAKAEAGDAAAMFELYTWYREEENGLSWQTGRAIRWLKKASDLHHPHAMAEYGLLLVRGVDVQSENVPYGLLLIGRAATLGSMNACLFLGTGHVDGSHGLPKDAKLTKYYYKKALDGICENHDSTDVDIEEAKTWLADNATQAPRRVLRVPRQGAVNIQHNSSDSDDEGF